VREICKDNSQSIDNLSNFLKLAMSDNGSWVAILNDKLGEPPEGRSKYTDSLYGNYSILSGFKKCLSCEEKEIIQRANFCPICGVKFKCQK